MRAKAFGDILLQNLCFNEVYHLASSKITKKALANALKEVMVEKPFEKISVSDICNKCNRNRKSFYYHFKDKYDLVNWIFDTEFLEGASRKNYDGVWELLTDTCEFFYNNREFYCKALRINGQNSFLDYFRELLLYIIDKTLPAVTGEENISDFQRNFMADAFGITFLRWVLEYPTMPPEEFMEQLRICIKFMAVGYEKLD